MRQQLSEAILMTSREALRRPALIRGHGHQRICIVITFKNGATAGSGWDQVFKAPIKVLDGKDDFEDGAYELVLGAQVFTLTKNGGEYQEIGKPARKAASSSLR